MASFVRMSSTGLALLAEPIEGLLSFIDTSSSEAPRCIAQVRVVANYDLDASCAVPQQASLSTVFVSRATSSEVDNGVCVIETRPGRLVTVSDRTGHILTSVDAACGFAAAAPFRGGFLTALTDGSVLYLRGGEHTRRLQAIATTVVVVAIDVISDTRVAFAARSGAKNAVQIVIADIEKDKEKDEDGLPTVEVPCSIVATVPLQNHDFAEEALRCTLVSASELNSFAMLNAATGQVRFYDRSGAFAGELGSVAGLSRGHAGFFLSVGSSENHAVDADGAVISLKHIRVTHDAPLKKEVKKSQRSRVEVLSTAHLINNENTSPKLRATHADVALVGNKIVVIAPVGERGVTVWSAPFPDGEGGRRHVPVPEDGEWVTQMLYEPSFHCSSDAIGAHYVRRTIAVAHPPGAAAEGSGFVVSWTKAPVRVHSARKRNKTDIEALMSFLTVLPSASVRLPLPVPRGAEPARWNPATLRGALKQLGRTATLQVLDEALGHRGIDLLSLSSVDGFLGTAVSHVSAVNAVLSLQQRLSFSVVLPSSKSAAALTSGSKHAPLSEEDARAVALRRYAFLLAACRSLASPCGQIAGRWECVSPMATMHSRNTCLDTALSANELHDTVAGLIARHLPPAAQRPGCVFSKRKTVGDPCKELTALASMNLNADEAATLDA